MSYLLRFKPKSACIKIELPASKSIANRLLVMQALSGHQLKLNNLSEAEDTQLLEAALKSNEATINVGLAGTAYRFLTAYYATQINRDTVLDGAKRMHERPIKILVEVLRELGAAIHYLKNEGFPPLQIKGKQLRGGKITVDGSISSQYISALLMIAPYLENDLNIQLRGRVVSLPYIDLTIDLMKSAGAMVHREGKELHIKKGAYLMNHSLQVEADWSAAAFFYQFVALSTLTIELNGLTINSLQGDQKTALHFEKLGVGTAISDRGLRLFKTTIPNTAFASFNLVDCPDLIPAIATASAQLINKTEINGAATLRIKESNRVEALQQELAKVNVKLIDLGEDSFEVYKAEKPIETVPVFNTHNDHRMAMCLAPLACIFPSIRIENPEVVSKSFPSYWQEIKKLGISIS